MAYKFNPFTGNLDFYTRGLSGPSVTTDNAITRWDGTNGTLVQNSKAIVQDGGGIEAQAFLFHRNIQDTVLIPSEYSMIATDIVIDSGEIIISADAELVII
jgi:hypothetical protein